MDVSCKTECNLIILYEVVHPYKLKKLCVSSQNILTRVLNGGKSDIGRDCDVGDDHYVGSIHVSCGPPYQRCSKSRLQLSDLIKVSSTLTKIKWAPMKIFFLRCHWMTSKVIYTIFPDDCFSSKAFFIGQWNPISSVGEVVDVVQTFKMVSMKRHS